MRLARLRQVIALLVALLFHRGVAQLFQIGQRGVDHARAGRIEAVAERAQRLDEFIAVARALLKQAQQHQLQVVRRHAASPREPAPVAAETVGVAPAVGRTREPVAA
ncbi:hypothetical protein G6F60_015360 [Rhizopus arrhizus]|nr:hypothetical protein G6F60_015360 [Rhizopus arrhizus]